MAWRSGETVRRGVGEAANSSERLVRAACSGGCSRTEAAGKLDRAGVYSHLRHWLGMTTDVVPPPASACGRCIRREHCGPTIISWVNSPAAPLAASVHSTVFRLEPRRPRSRTIHTVFDAWKPPSRIGIELLKLARCGFNGYRRRNRANICAFFCRGELQGWCGL